jgi:hypothetical protein
MTFEDKIPILLALEAPLSPGERRSYDVHEIGDDRYQLQDANSGRVILTQATGDTIAGYLKARQEADGGEAFESIGHYVKTKRYFC